MRKLYLLITGLTLCLLSFQSKAQSGDVANFTFTIATPGNLVHFTNTSVLDGTAPRKALWSFGDGSAQWTGPLENTQHHYTAAGTYTVCLKIFRYSNSGDSVLTSSVCKTVVIATACAANYEYRDSLLPGTTQHHVKFWAIPNHNANKPVTEICWDFGDGSPKVCIQYPNTAGNDFSVHHTYPAHGTYNVCVRIKYQDGCVAEKCKPIILRPLEDTCKADFEVRPLSTSTSPLGKTFIAQPWHSNNKRPERICWSFGDGKDTCIDYNPSQPHNYAVNHVYQQPGNYNVCVKIKYQGGCEASKCKHVQVGTIDSCKANFERIANTTNNPLTASFKALPWHSNNKKPKLVCWYFGDGKDTCIEYAETYNGSYTVTHTYPRADTFEVCIKILYYGGCAASECKRVIIGNTDTCKADFEVDHIASSLLTKRFTAIPWHSQAKKPVRVCWSFGDGKDTCIQYLNTFSGPYSVSHTYTQPGNYNVCVKILYQGGCEASKCKAVHAGVVPDSCKADFERSPVVGNNPLTVGFKALPWHNNNKKPKQICWKFGDGKDTCIQYPENYTGPYTVGHTYAVPGNYEVCVKILYYGGCEAHKCKLVQVGEPPVTCRAAFEVDNIASSPLTKKFTAIPWHSQNKKPIKICWYFGDGKSTMGYCSLASGDGGWG